jgi:hypothetical protein
MEIENLLGWEHILQIHNQLIKHNTSTPRRTGIRTHTFSCDRHCCRTEQTGCNYWNNNAQQNNLILDDYFFRCSKCLLIVHFLLPLRFYLGLIYSKINSKQSFVLCFFISIFPLDISRYHRTTRELKY